MLSGNKLPAEWVGVRRALEARQEEARRAILQGFQREAEQKAWAKAQAEEAAQVAAQAAAAELAKKAARQAAKLAKEAKKASKAKAQLARLEAKRLRRATEAGRKAGLQAGEARKAMREKIKSFPATDRRASALRAELKALPTPAKAFKAAYTAVLEGRKAGVAKARRAKLNKTMQQVREIFNNKIPSDLSQGTAKVAIAIARHERWGRLSMNKFCFDWKPVVEFIAATGATVDEAKKILVEDTAWPNCVDILYAMTDPSILAFFRKMVDSGYPTDIIALSISCTDDREDYTDEWVITEEKAVLAEELIQRLQAQKAYFGAIHAVCSLNHKKLPAHPRFFELIKKLYGEASCYHGLARAGVFPAKGFVPPMKTWEELEIIAEIWPLFGALAKTKRWAGVKEEIDIQSANGNLGWADGKTACFNAVGEAILGFETESYESLHNWVNRNKLENYNLLDSSWKGFYNRLCESFQKQNPSYTSWDLENNALPVMFKISTRLPRLADLGITAKSSVSSVLAALDSVIYEGSNTALMAEAARWKVDDSDYPEIESRWDEGLKKPKTDFIKALQEVEVKVGSRRVFMLPHEDTRGIFLGEHTNCCQHPGGAGSDAAWYGHEESHAGFVVLEESGVILAQGLVWQTKSSNTLCFDNIEAKGGSSRVAQLIPAFQSWCKAAKISATMGTGYMASEAFSKLDLAVTQEPLDGWSSLRYTDARDQRVLHMA